MELTVVALPREDDPVWQISSEKVPHLTLLYLGDKFDENDYPRVREFVRHACKTSVQPFGLQVDSRGELGPDKADVFFFEKDDYGLESPKKLRDFLLQDPAISLAFNSVDQYPEWTPHLTLGYPKKPAKPIKEEYRYHHWVEFDRIALWWSDSDGDVFKLERQSSMAVEYSRGGIGMAEKANIFLAHYGVKGMKWGVIRDNYNSTRKIVAETLTVKTKTGKEVTLKEAPKGRLASALGTIFGQKYRDNIKNYRSFDMYADGKKVGHAAFNHESKEELNLVWLGVNPDQRGKGYATSVFDAGVKYASSKGYSKITLEVPGNAPDALHIYEKFGFRKTDKVYDEEEEDSVWGGLTNMVYDIPKKGK